MNIILASNSPRRTQILTLAQIYHQVVPSACEETIAQNLEPYEVVESLSYQKAADVAKKYPDDIIIGAVDALQQFQRLFVGVQGDRKVRL